MENRQHKGQVALTLVLIMTVVSVLAVSLATRSTIDTKIQESESQSIQALLSAQTGVEQLMMSPLQTSVSNTTYVANRTDVGMEGLTVGRAEEGSTWELNLEGADFVSLNGFSVYWKPDVSGDGATPAVFVSVFSSGGVITDYAYDYLGNNGFTPGDDGSGLGYAKKTPNLLLSGSESKIHVTVLGSPAMMEIVPLGAGAVFPSQLKEIKSVGLTKAEDKTVKYGLQYDESASDTVPAVFDYAVFSGGSISQ